MTATSSGHIEQLPSGSWRSKVYAGTDPLTGREIRFRKTRKTEIEAQIELGKLLALAQAGRQPDTDVTVAELLDQYVPVTGWDVYQADTWERVEVSRWRNSTRNCRAAQAEASESGRTH